MVSHYCGVRVREGDYGLQDRDVINEVIVRDSYRLDIRGLRSDYAANVIDVGAHIGSFAKLWHSLNPAAKIVCVEACPDNSGTLRANVGLIASVEDAACTYEQSDLVLHNSIMPGGTATGGSMVTDVSEVVGPKYWLDTRPLKKVTLEELMCKYSMDRVHCLKLDCEGSEFSILENAMCLDRVGFICGEYHDRARWDALVRLRFADWGHCNLHASGNLGIFHLQNPDWEHFTGGC